MKVYVASSWRNNDQPTIVWWVRFWGHDVYDFRAEGFHWMNIDPKWETWTTDEYITALSHPLASNGFIRDKSALDNCDLVILVLPSGRSAHIEAGYAKGREKKVIVYCPATQEPELMNKMFDRICQSLVELYLTILDIRKV